MQQNRIREAITKAGGPSLVGRACDRRHSTIISWCNRNTLPSSEWKGESSFARIISDLARAYGHSIDPLELCPGAAQYMRDQRLGQLNMEGKS